MSGPSDKAVEAVAKHYGTGSEGAKERARDVLAPAHSERLGLDRSVCLRDVLTVMRQRPVATTKAELEETSADYVERVLGSGA